MSSVGDSKCQAPGGRNNLVSQASQGGSRLERRLRCRECLPSRLWRARWASTLSRLVASFTIKRMAVRARRGEAVLPSLPLGLWHPGADTQQQKWFKGKGFCLITPDDGCEEIFIHCQQLVGTEELQQGDNVSHDTTTARRSTR